MRENNFNSKFIDLIRDEDFIQLVKEAEDPARLLTELILHNTENSKAIKYAFEFIMLAKDDKRKLDNKDSEVILENIEKRLLSNKPKVGIRYVSILKIASIIFLITTFGSLLFYYQYTRDPLKQFSEKNPSKGDMSLIILSNGSKHVLDNNDSKIDYNLSKEEVVIEKGEKEEEKIQNFYGSDPSALNQVVVPYGQRQRVVLSDGTTVKLNAGSVLTFPVVFSDKEREVYLKGEGFFEVHKDPSHSFIVRTDFMNVKVLGTKFNVSAYEDENIAFAVLVEGSVDIRQKNRILRNESFVLSPGQGCFYSIDHQKTSIKDVDVNLYTSWVDGVYQFKDESLLDVVKKVEKYYNVPVQVGNQKLSGTEISGKLLISDDVDEILQYIAKTVESRLIKTKDGIYVLENEYN